MRVGADEIEFEVTSEEGVVNAVAAEHGVEITRPLAEAA